MTNRTKFIIGILILLGIVFAIEYRTARKFVWIPTFSHTDAQPFGCMLFDSVMQASMPHGYSVTKKTVWQLEKDSTLSTSKSLLIATDEFIDDYSCKRLLQLVDKGHTVLVATGRLSFWEDTLGIESNMEKTFHIDDIVGRNVEKGLIGWDDDENTYKHYPLAVLVYEQMIEYTLSANDSVPCEVLLNYMEVTQVEHQGGHGVSMTYLPIALSFKRGKGELILVSAPLLFTNYMTISGQGSLIQARLMDRLKRHPVIRFESYKSATAQTEHSSFYVLLKQPPLRWALYLSVLSILLFCIFTARRRQRVIPVIQKPQNMNLEFVRLIGSLYWQQHDNAGLLAKKLAYATEEIRRQNVRLSADDNELLTQIREYAYGGYVIPDKTLKYYINELNRILQSL